MGVGMKATIWACGIAVALAVGMAPAAPGAAHADTQPSGYDIVQVRAGASIDDIDAADDTSVAGADEGAGLYRVALPPGSDPSSMLARLRSTPGVAYAEPDQAIQVPEAQQSSRPFYEATATSSTYMGQYALNLVGAPAAHTFSSGQGVT